MGCRVLIFAVLLLAGCAADPSDIRAPRNDAERTAVDAQVVRVNEVRPVLGRANFDLCKATMGAACHLDVWVGASSRLGAFDGTKAIGITLGLMEDLKTNDEIALVIGHEWVHQFMDHGHKGYGIKAESDADCVGAVMIVRAGYDLAAARRLYTEVVSNIEAGQSIMNVAALVLVGAIPEASEHPSSSQRTANLDRIASDLKTRKARGETINRSTIEQVCNVKF